MTYYTNAYTLMNKALLLILAILFYLSINAQEVKVQSPDRQLEVHINTNPDISWSIYYKNKQILKESKIALQLNDGYLLGINQKLLSKQPTSILEVTNLSIPTKTNSYKSFYKGMIFTFKVSKLREYKVEFRVFNHGVAYRFITNFENEIKVENEFIELNFPKNSTGYFPENTKMISRFEPNYQFINMDTIALSQSYSLPILMKVDSVSMLFSEMNLIDYPNMFLKTSKRGQLSAVFPNRVKEMRPEPKMPYRNEIIVVEERDIALTFGKRKLPWRFFIVSENDGDLIESTIPYSLSGPSIKKSKQELEWIRPCHVVCDLYDANGQYKENNIKESNSNYYKKNIDFAAKYGFEYLMISEGWSKSTTNITHTRKGFDLQEIVKYAENKNVGIILWMLWKPLDEHMDSVLKTYEKWGIKGISVDFMQRGDQYMVNFYERLAQSAAKHRIVVIFNASFKPVGLSKAYPNVLSYQAVRGNKYNRFTKDITPEHKLIIPFIRMAVGPMDFAPGSMQNVHANQFQISPSKPMSIGTRCNELAMYVAYESGLQKLYDAPSVYENDSIIPQLISRIPVVWDETKVLEGKIGELLIIARRKGKNWYVGAMNHSKEREVNLHLRDFLSQGNYELTIVEDGPLANIEAKDYSMSKKIIASNQSINIYMAAGGGCLAIFEPIKSRKKKKKRR